MKDVVSALSNVQVLGTGFLQPKRNSPKVTIKSDHIIITDEKKKFSEEWMIWYEIYSQLNN